MAIKISVSTNWNIWGSQQKFLVASKIINPLTSIVVSFSYLKNLIMEKKKKKVHHYSTIDHTIVSVSQS